MIVSHPQLKAYQIKNELIKNIMDFEESLELSKALNNALKNMPQDIDDEQFTEYLETTYDLIDKICFIILVSKFGNSIFKKNPYYISELCTSITIKHISPLNFVSYATYFLSDPIYTLIVKIADKSAIYGYIDLFGIIIANFNILNMTDKEKEEIIHALNLIANKDSHILFSNTDTLKDIYIILLTNMQNLNKTTLLFTLKDFETLHLLKNILTNPDEELKIELQKKFLEIEQHTLNIASLIKECLKIIHEYSYKFAHMTLVRRAHSEKE